MTGDAERQDSFITSNDLRGDSVSDRGIGTGGTDVDAGSSISNSYSAGLPRKSIKRSGDDDPGDSYHHNPENDGGSGSSGITRGGSGRVLPPKLSAEDDWDSSSDDTTSSLRRVSAVLLSSLFCCGGGADAVAAAGGKVQQVQGGEDGQPSRPTTFAAMVSMFPIDRTMPTIFSGEVLAMTPRKMFPGSGRRRETEASD